MAIRASDGANNKSDNNDNNYDNNHDINDNNHNSIENNNCPCQTTHNQLLLVHSDGHRCLALHPNSGSMAAMIT